MTRHYPPAHTHTHRHPPAPTHTHSHACTGIIVTASTASTPLTLRRHQFRRPVGMWLLRTIMNHKTRGKVQPKSGMIVTKWNMLAGIRKVRELDMSVCLIPVEKLLIKNVRVKPDVVLELKEKRDAVVNSFADYKRVLDTVDSCNAMRECRSLNHMKPAGCPMCGGIESVRGLHVISVGTTRQLSHPCRTMSVEPSCLRQSTYTLQLTYTPLDPRPRDPGTPHVGREDSSELGPRDGEPGQGRPDTA